MSSYYLDTNVLVGYTFLHNRWQEHTTRLMDTDNTLYAGETVLWEYCVKVGAGPRDGEPAKWSEEDGVFGTVKRNLRKYKRLTYLELESMDESEIDPETVSKVFFEEFDTEDQVKDKVRNYFNRKLDDDCTLDDVEEALNYLINRINSTSVDRKEELKKRVKIRKRRQDKDYQSQSDQLSRIIDGDDEEFCGDAEVLCDAMDLKDRYIIHKVVTGDKSDMQSHMDKIEAITGLKIVYLKNEFANEDTEKPAETAG